MRETYKTDPVEPVEHVMCYPSVLPPVGNSTHQPWPQSLLIGTLRLYWLVGDPKYAYLSCTNDKKPETPPMRGPLLCVSFLDQCAASFRRTTGPAAQRSLSLFYLPERGLQRMPWRRRAPHIDHIEPIVHVTALTKKTRE